MFCASLQPAAAQYLASLTGAIASRQLSTQLGPYQLAAERLKEPEPQRQPAPHSVQDQHEDRTERPSLPLFFAGVQLNNPQPMHVSPVTPLSHQPPSTRPSTAHGAPTAPPPSALVIPGGAEVSKQLLPLLVQAALRSGGLAQPQAVVACLSTMPPSSLSPLPTAPTTALAPAPPRLTHHLQLARQAPSTIVADAHRERTLQLRLHAAGSQLEACPPPSKDLQLCLRAAWGPPGPYEPPRRELQLRPPPPPAMPPNARLPPPPKDLQPLLRVQLLPLEACAPLPKELQLRQPPAVARPPAPAPPVPPEAVRPLAPGPAAGWPLAAPATGPSELRLLTHPTMAAAALPPRAAPTPGSEASCRPSLGPAVSLQGLLQGPVASPEQGPLGVAEPLGPLGPPLGPGDAALPEPAVERVPPAAPPRTGRLPMGGQQAHTAAPLEPTAAAAAAAAAPSREGMHPGAGLRQEQQHQGGGDGSAGDSGWQWADDGARHGAGGEGDDGSTGRQATGGSYQFMLLLAAALAGVMGLHRWPQHRAALQEAAQPAPTTTAPAAGQQWGGEELQEDEEVHPLIKTMREALEHLEARQAALELEVACLKAIHRPSADSMERRKEVDEELRSLAILHSAVEQELRRLHG